MRLLRSVAALLAVGSVIGLFVAAGAGEDGMVQVGGTDGRVFERGPAILGPIILGVGLVLVYLGFRRSPLTTIGRSHMGGCTRCWLRASSRGASLS